MNTVSTDYLIRAEVWLTITTLVYFLMNGAQIFETFVIIPKWTANAPFSFQMFKGEFGLDLKTFWIAIHSLHEITFIVAIVFCWELDFIRNWLLILFIIHFTVRVWTIAYFAPNIIEFQRIANGNILVQNLAQKANMWRKLNYLRVILFLAVSFGLIPLCLELLPLIYR